MTVLMYIAGWPYQVTFRGTLETYWVPDGKALCFSGENVRIKFDQDRLDQDRAEIARMFQREREYRRDVDEIMEIMRDRFREELERTKRPEPRPEEL